MKRLLLFFSLFIVVVLVLALSSQPTQALPEYSEQTGEPCATCHVSPSGGGIRTPRGQAWVADGKPGAVTDLSGALEILGVNLDINESDFKAPPEATLAPPEPPQVKPGQADLLHRWLKDYQGN